MDEKQDIICDQSGWSNDFGCEEITGCQNILVILDKV